MRDGSEEELRGASSEIAALKEQVEQLNMRLKAVERGFDGEWVVYEIHEKGDEEWPFYIGLTTNVERRMGEHDTNRQSAVYAKLRALEHVGQEAEYSVLAKFTTLEAAQIYEAGQIALRPNLFNRNIVECRERFGFSEKFWNWIGSVHSLMQIEQTGCEEATAADLGLSEEEAVALLDEGAEK